MTKEALNELVTKGYLLQVKKEIIDQTASGTAAMIRLAKEETVEQIKEQMKKDKMDILGAVAEFGKRTDDLEVGGNFLTARVEEHEERLTKIESKITDPTS